MSARTYAECIGLPGSQTPAPFELSAMEQKIGALPLIPAPLRTSSHARRYPSAAFGLQALDFLLYVPEEYELSADLASDNGGSPKP